MMLLTQILGTSRTIAMENPTYKQAYRVFETVVPRAVSAAEAAAAGESVFAYDPEGKVAASFSRLAEEVRRG